MRGIGWPTTGVGEVLRVFANDGAEGKTAVTRVTVMSSEYGGKGRDGAARYFDRYATLLAFGDAAAAMKVLVKGDRVAFSGSAQAGRPYKAKDGQDRADLEIKVDRWAPVAEGPAIDQPEPDAGEASDPSFDDPFADE